MTTDQMISELSGLSTLFNYGPLWEQIKNSGVTGALVQGGLLMTFGVMMISLFLNMKDSIYGNSGYGHKNILSINAPIFIKAFITALFILYYVIFCDQILLMFSAFSDMFFKKSLLQFQANLHFLLASISAQTDSQTATFFPNMKASLEIFLFSVSLDFVIVLFYIMIVYCPAFVIIGLLAGPMLIPISLYSKSVGLKWLLFLVAAGLFPAFVGIGLQIINDGGYVAALATSNLEGKMIQAIFLATTIFIFITTIPATVATLFGARPLASFSMVMGFLTICAGMFTTSLSTLAQVMLPKKKRAT
jgi:hypothetical protein